MKTKNIDTLSTLNAFVFVLIFYKIFFELYKDQGKYVL